MLQRLLFLAALGCSGLVRAQEPEVMPIEDIAPSLIPDTPHDDTLRGTITPERAWWDLTFYDLRVLVNPTYKAIQGRNTIHYRVLEANHQVLQIDLQPPLLLGQVEQNGQRLGSKQIGRNAYLIYLPAAAPVGSDQSLTVHFGGEPHVAQNAPWDGGFSWSKDENGQPFAATSCQGLGASAWWPCKDHLYDEPDSMRIAVTVPTGLTDVSNGRLRRVSDEPNGLRTFEWFVQNPISNYAVNVNIAHYVHFSDTFPGEKGPLSLDYYVLPANLEAAKTQFVQVKMMLKAFEHWFGPYPFYEDGYKLVQVPYLGMEHQSSVTYGNGFRNGYLGSDLSGSGQGLKWDFIIIHESGHEWFANNITVRDIADMWVHEGFTAYSENLYTEFYFGKTAGTAYVVGTRKRITNDRPIIGPYGVNQEGSSDMYYKGANLLHTIRQIVNDDAKWRDILRGLNRDFYHQTVDSKQIEDYISARAGRNLSKVFDQYLRTVEIPVLEYRLHNKRLKYRWTNCLPGFDMPVKFWLQPGEAVTLYPTETWQSIRCLVPPDKLSGVDQNFYVEEKRL